MCGLCGILGVDTHWSDAASTPAAFAGRDATRRQERLRRVALVNRMLKPFAVTAKDWQGASYLLATATGKSTVVDHLGSLWPEAEKLAGRPLDPLDPALIAALDASAEPPS